MKKIIAMLLALGMTVSLWGCGEEGSNNGAANSEVTTGTGTDQKQDGGNKAAGSGEVSENEETAEGLRILNTGDNQSCYTEAGYYYFAEPLELSDENWGMHLMYMDFATAQEIYLCNNAGCNHDTIDCPAVFSVEEFPCFSTIPFIHGNSLYFLSKSADQDGSVSFSATEDGVNVADVENSTSYLYRANIDGTGREKIYTFGENVTLEDVVMGDDQGIYVITKTLTADKTAEGTYFNSTERKLVYLDLETLEEKMVCDLEFGDSISWKLIDCYGQNLVFEGLDYGREVTNQELFDDDSYVELYEQSKEVIATVNINDGKLNEVYRMAKEKESSFLTKDNLLYISWKEDGRIISVNMDSGEEKEVCKSGNNYLFRAVGDKLCCTNWDLGEDATFYYVDTKTGEVSHSELVNKCNGWRLEFRAELESDMLMVYDYEAIRNPDDSYEISRYQYGLISKEDLFLGNDNFRKIDMIKGGI